MQGKLSSTIAVTGSAGLIGRALCSALLQAGYAVREIDLAFSTHDVRYGNILDRERMEALLTDVDGVVHLAAVSRVVLAEQNPELCWAVNSEGTEQLVKLLARTAPQAWFLFVSSREVYGQATRFPCSEHAPFNPLNVYARSKIAGEQIAERARDGGVITGIVRLSTVYGGPNDHPTRLIPAFMSAAMQNSEFRIDGERTFVDPTFLDDVIEGLILLIRRLFRRQSFSPVHFVSGQRVALLELARIVSEIAGSSVNLTITDPRPYDVAGFEGDPTYAIKEFGWRASTPLNKGLSTFRARWETRDGGQSQLKPSHDGVSS
jgi:UDP-glucose 4-epimerase